MKRLVLLDSHAIIHRAWHALPPLTSPEGQPVNAVYGFASLLLKMLRELKPDYVVAAFDHEGPTFRHLAFERYKAGRAKAPDALYQQMPMVKELVRAFGIPAIEQPGYEADDLIGTITRKVGEKHADVEVVIVTGDLDILQLVDARTRVFTMRKGFTDTVLYDEAAVHARYGLSPKQLVDFKGLRGDPSDNIPGVKGIGEKTAAELLRAHGTVEGIYKTLKKGRLAAKPAVIEALKRHEADALFSKTLATIDTSVPVKFILAPARLRKSAAAGARPALERLGFSSLVRRLGGRDIAPAAPQPSAMTTGRPVPSVVSAARFADLPRSKTALFFFDGERKKLLVAVSQDKVFELPPAALGGAAAEAWLGSCESVSAFDLKTLLHAGFPAGQARRTRNLMVVWWLVEPGRRSYEPQAFIRKELRERTGSPVEIASRLFELAPALEQRLEAEELRKVYEELEAPLTPILFGMEATGIGFNPKPLGALSKKFAQELGRLEGVIHRAAGAPFNINSPRQLAEVLFEKLKLAPRGIRKTERSGALSTRESELAKLRASHPMVDDVLRYRELAKLQSTYVDALPALVGRDGRIRTTWNQTGTATGRLSSQEPNLQNIPIRSEHGREIRKAFRAATGYALVAFDYSQLELRIAADLANDAKMMEAFRRGQDIHRLTAAEVSNVPLARVTAELRARAKTLNFGVLYGMGARAFAEAAGVRREEAEHFIEEYFRNFQGITRFIEETKEFARAHGYTKTAFGRKRFFPDMGATNFRLARLAERQAVNFPIQGTAADIMKRAMIAVDGWIAAGLRDDVRMLLQIHDELIFEVRKRRLKTAIPEIRRLMEGVWPGKVAMRVDVTQGSNWGELG